MNRNLVVIIGMVIIGVLVLLVISRSAGQPQLSPTPISTIMPEATNTSVPTQAVSATPVTSLVQ